MFKRIGKREARAMYGKKTFIMVPSKLRPDSFAALKVSPDLTCIPEYSFDAFVNAFEFYNCCYEETGRQAAYYKEGKD